jgi:hypothetical protein
MPIMNWLRRKYEAKGTWKGRVVRYAVSLECLSNLDASLRVPTLAD